MGDKRKEFRKGISLCMARTSDRRRRVRPGFSAGDKRGALISELEHTTTITLTIQQVLHGMFRFGVQNNLW